MSDLYNENNGNEMSQSENPIYNHYESSTHETEDKIKKNKSSHTLLKVLAFVLSLVIVGAGSVQVYKFWDNNKIEITVPFNQNTSELAMAMVDKLSGIPINVSLQFLNDTIEAGGRKDNYNNVYLLCNIQVFYWTMINFCKYLLMLTCIFRNLS